MNIQRHDYKLSWKGVVGVNLLIILFHLFYGMLTSSVHSEMLAVPPIWISNGVSLALIMVFGLGQVIPGILIGTLIICSFTKLPGITVVGLLGAKTLEGLMASMLLHSIGKGTFRFKSPKDILAFILIGGFLTPFVSSTITITFYFIGATFPVETIPRTWVSIYAGISLGILIITPFILSFFNKKSAEEKPGTKREGVACFLILALVSYWALDTQSIRQFLIIPVLTWIALRFSFRGVALSSAVVATAALLREVGPEHLFSGENLSPDFLWIQALVCGITIVGYFMATVKGAFEVASEKELELSINLRHKKLAEDALAILDQTIHMSPIGYALIDRDYKFIRINQTLANVHGIEPQLHYQRCLTEILPTMSKKMIPMIERVFETGNSLTNVPIQGRFNLDSKEVTSALVSYYPISHPGTKESFGVAINFQDISQLLITQNLLRENQDRLALAQEAGKIGAFEWCLDTDRIIWTQELENIYGLKNGEFGGFIDSWLKWIHLDDLESFQDEFNHVIYGDKELNHEFRIVTSKNEVRWILARGKMIKSLGGNKIKLIGINIDLTEQKKYEQQLRLTEANLLHALAVRDEFVAVASHELKTPLTSLKLQLQMFEKGVLNNDQSYLSPDKLHKLMERNSLQIDRLTRLVDDMLDISRIRTGKLTLKKEFCDLTVLLKDILSRSKTQFESCGSGQPVIEQFDHAIGTWDPLRIEQVLTNIITNAIRYGGGKVVTITVRNYADFVRISVKDQGLGIPKSDHKKIFERYERGLLKREVSGLGLGLFITRQIVDAHHGQIWVESELQQGSTFYIDLPREPLDTIPDRPSFIKQLESSSVE